MVRENFTTMATLARTFRRSSLELRCWFMDSSRLCRPKGQNNSEQQDGKLSLASFMVRRYKESRNDAIWAFGPIFCFFFSACRHWQPISLDSKPFVFRKQVYATDFIFKTHKTQTGQAAKKTVEKQMNTQNQMLLFRLLL